MLGQQKLLMKNIYFEAARKIAEGEVEFACHAIQAEEEFAGHAINTQEARDRFNAVFDPGMGQSSYFSIGAQGFKNPEAMNCRVLALLLMHWMQ